VENGVPNLLPPYTLGFVQSFFD